MKKVVPFLFLILLILASTSSELGAQIEKPKDQPKPGGGGSSGGGSNKAAVEVTWKGSAAVNITFANSNGSTTASFSAYETKIMSVNPEENFTVSVEYPNALYKGNEFIKFERGKTYMDIWLSGSTVRWDTETDAARRQRIADEAAEEAERIRLQKEADERAEKERKAKEERDRLAAIQRQKEQARQDSVDRVVREQRAKEESARAARQAAIDARNKAIADSIDREKKLVFAREIQSQMVLVTGGTFSMGATKEQANLEADSKITHAVTLDAYKIGRFEITQRLWKGIMGYNPSKHTDCAECPVENVSYLDVLGFIQELNKLTGLNYRLPTEAEWEFAARGGTKSNSFKYSGGFIFGDVGWTKENSSATTHPVGMKTANELGLYDMSGNVWEWCSDWYEESYYSKSPGTNPTGAIQGSYRVARGGSYFNPCLVSRISVREGALPGNKYADGGFRLVCSA